jgi:cardiolipin synthase A/B
MIADSPALQTPSPVPDRVVTAISERRAVFLDTIRRATREITLSFYRCSDPEIFLELSRAVARGVEVNIIVTSRGKGGPKKLEKLWTPLLQTGASVHAYRDPVVKYHAKYLVVDDGPAIVASLNLTQKCFERTCDALVLTYDPAVVSDLRRLMAADRDGEPIPADLSLRLVIGPERARWQFTSIIQRAQSSIRLIDPKLSDPDLVELLNARRADGLKIEVFGSTWLGDLRSHGKIMLVDDRIAVVGGLALAALSLDFRREVAIVVEDPDAVAEVRQLFGAIDAVPTLGRSRTADARGLTL